MRHTAGFTHGLGTDAFDNQYTKANVFGLDVPLAEMMTSSRQFLCSINLKPSSFTALGPTFRHASWRSFQA